MRSLATITLMNSKVYWLKVEIILYFILAPTVSAVFEGRVHGVVVQAKIKRLLYFFKKSGSEFLIVLN